MRLFRLQKSKSDFNLDWQLEYVMIGSYLFSRQTNSWGIVFLNLYKPIQWRWWWRAGCHTAAPRPLQWAATGWRPRRTRPGRRSSTPGKSRSGWTDPKSKDCRFLKGETWGESVSRYVSTFLQHPKAPYRAGCGKDCGRFSQGCWRRPWPWSCTLRRRRRALARGMDGGVRVGGNKERMKSYKCDSERRLSTQAVIPESSKI